MNRIRGEVCEYYSKMIKFEIQINSDRNKIIATIRDIEKIKLNNLQELDSIFQDFFCIFKPTRKYQNEKDYEGNFNFYKRIGQLVVINNTFDENTINKLKYRDRCNGFEKSFEFRLFSQLIDFQKDELIIDLTVIENNYIRDLDIGHEVNGENLKYLSKYLNAESVKTLKISCSDIIHLENNIFESFKHLTKLILNLHNAESLNENISNRTCLINYLRELFFDRFSIHNPDIINNLEKLKILDFSQCSTSIFEMNSLNVSLNSIKCLEIDEWHVESLNINPNLEIINMSIKPWSYYSLGIPDNVLNLKMLKFLKAGVIQLNDIFLLDELSQLEYLDLTLTENLEEFNLVNFSKLKYLVLTCKKIPKFNGSKTLQGLELKNAEIIPHDAFDNLVQCLKFSRRIGNITSFYVILRKIT
ncbi:unnamed protein product [Brachionus calyciflorus]|uniref:Uncharacterized protein n=1 Tax=Brachionus calyciflorus TaxID=104777 RepID=A0A814IFP3_9BILA|nr:unnamed protein product [Brachionus calyciflorus]